MLRHIDLSQLAGGREDSAVRTSNAVKPPDSSDDAPGGPGRGSRAQSGLAKSVASFSCEDDKSDVSVRKFDDAGDSPIRTTKNPNDDFKLEPKTKDKGGCCECIIAYTCTPSVTIVPHVVEKSSLEELW